MKRTFAFLLSSVLVSLSAANLLPGDTSAETERATAGNGNFGAMIYGFGDARLTWDKSNGFDGKSSLKAMTADVYSLKSSLKLRKGEKYTFSFYAKSERNGVRGQINCVPSDLRQWPLPAGGRNIVFTPEWQRYSFTFTAQKDSPYSGIYRVIEDKAKVNFDAFMLEPGE
ncbi:MAG: carbohydrate binding domain-containing protein [Lentisphaeria bacterium]|nr:carbohydrate binding domain-containing protein [Lentisphaeria bacterium]